MTVTRDVVLDLLPLYLANEASADTRILVEKYLETDPELAHMAAESAELLLPDDSPVPLTTEDQMKAYLEAKRFMFRRNLTWAIVIGLAIFMAFALAVLAASFLISA
jgi:predicted anti-sigma-YlaC factor YlaD